MTYELDAEGTGWEVTCDHCGASASIEDAADWVYVTADIWADRLGLRPAARSHGVTIDWVRSKDGQDYHHFCSPEHFGEGVAAAFVQGEQA